jgi:hypothetical protein
MWLAFWDASNPNCMLIASKTSHPRRPVKKWRSAGRQIISMQQPKNGAIHPCIKDAELG